MCYKVVLQSVIGSPVRCQRFFKLWLPRLGILAVGELPAQDQLGRHYLGQARAQTLSTARVALSCLSVGARFRSFPSLFNTKFTKGPYWSQWRKRRKRSFKASWIYCRYWKFVVIIHMTTSGSAHVIDSWSWALNQKALKYHHCTYTTRMYVRVYYVRIYVYTHTYACMRIHI